MQLLNHRRFWMVDCGFRPLDAYDVQEIESVQDFLREVGTMPKLIFAEDGQDLLDVEWVQEDYDCAALCGTLEPDLVVLQTDE